MSATTTERPTVDYDSASIGDLLRGIGEDSSLMLRQEMALAKAELTQKAANLGAAAGMLVVAGVVALAALGAGTAAAVAGLANVLPVWAAALVVMGAELLLAGVLGLLAKGRISAATPLAPERAVDNAKETKRELTS